jgi:hypothetical protein
MNIVVLTLGVFLRVGSGRVYNVPILLQQSEVSLNPSLQWLVFLFRQVIVRTSVASPNLNLRPREPIPLMVIKESKNSLKTFL